MDFKSITIITLGIVLTLVSLCYFFDTRKYKEGTVHSERKYRDLKNRYAELVVVNQSLTQKHKESIDKFYLKTEELQQKMTGLNIELEKKDLELEDALGKVDILQARIHSMEVATEAKNNDTEEV